MKKNNMKSDNKILLGLPILASIVLLVSAFSSYATGISESASALLPAVQLGEFEDYFLIPSTSSAQVDYFLKLDGIDGESTDDKHKNEIEIESFSWGETNAGASAGRSSGAGKVQMQDIHFIMKTNKATPKLMLAAATGEHIKEAILTVRKAGGNQQEYLEIKLTDVLVTSYQTGGSSNIAPTDQISLNFAKIEIQYSLQKEDGSLEAPVKAGYDLKLNKAV